MVRNNDINISLFQLQEHYFDHHSMMHGINHTYRVMYHVLNIGTRLGFEEETQLAFCAAYIHDMARIHDGYCTEHGAWAAKRKMPVFRELFMNSGIDEEGLRVIRLAVANHSIRHEISKNHHYYKTVALLKDADALDRIRIGEHNLKTEYLRYPESLEAVNFAKELYYRSNHMVMNDFGQLIDIAKTILHIK